MCVLFEHSGGVFKVGPLSVTGSDIVIEVDHETSLVMAYPPLNSSESGGATSWPVEDDVYSDVLSFAQCERCELTGNGLLHGGGITDSW